MTTSMQNLAGVCLLLLVITYSASYAQLAGNQQGDSGVSMTPLERHIHSVCNKVQEENKTTDNLTEGDLADLPVGIARQIGNGVYVIAIDSAYWDGTGWYFTAYASIQLPGSSRPIAFRANKVGFNKGGLTFSETKMVLVSPQYISISDQLALELPADDSNYLEFDCKGFKSVNLKGDFLLTNSSIIPDREKTSDSRVHASVEINTADLSNIIASLENVTPFKIAGLDDVSFEVKNASVDLSDNKNPDGFTLPPDYSLEYGDSPNLWRGFYLQELTVSLHGFQKTPTAIQARNMFIDDAGLSGELKAVSVFPLEEGSVDGWAISMNNLGLQFLHNSLTSGSFGGQIQVPLLGDEPFSYEGSITQFNSELDYKFLVNTSDDKEYNTKLSAVIKLKEGSTIGVEKRDGKLTASAILHGSISIKNEQMEAKGIEFQNLVLLSRPPYVRAPSFSTNALAPKALGFPITIQDISLKTPEEGKLALGFDVSINFMNEEAKGFSGKGRITIQAKTEGIVDVSNTNGLLSAARQSWTYDGIKFNDIALDCSTTALSVKGKLNLLEDDPEYGNGFQGKLSLSIAKVLDQGVQVSAYFGSKDGFRYWHFDAFSPTTNIPVAPSLFINGVIGGASYKMIRKGDFKPDFSKLNSEATGEGTLEASKDFSYTPDATAGLSFMAGVTLIAGSEKAFNSDAMLEVSFNQNGGFRYVQFKGRGYFFTSISTRGRSNGTETVNAPVFADINMMYDHNNGVFHSNLKAYMNLEGTIRGTGPNNMMGEAVMHFDSKDWYIFIGRPSSMLGVDIAHLAVASGYFMAGTQIEGMPQPPSEMRDILRQRNENLVRDETTLALGRGFAVGVRFETGFDSKDKLTPFYAAFKIGAGADMMIRDFGNASCAGSTEKIGFDGWYASGQAYVFMNGKVGIKVGGQKFDFLSLGAAALLQAKLPNPTWLKGELAGKYSVLGGWVDGTFNLKIIIGDECEIITPGTELGQLLVISDVKPDNASSDVSVFATPQASFNTSIDTEFRMLNNQDQLASYRVKLDEFNIQSNGQPLAARMEWNGRKDVLVLRTSELLPATTQLKAAVKVHWEKLENGSWKPLLSNNSVSYETKEFVFTTGEAPDFIPEENIAYSYPVNRQYNLLPQETNEGYIKLKQGQAYLFTSPPSEKWTFLVRFTDPKGSKLETTLNYNEGEAMARFPLPDQLRSQTVYTMSLIKRPESAESIDSNIKRETIAKQSAGSEVNIASNTLTGTLTQKIEKEIYASAFRTSRFKTFGEKWEALTGTQNLFDVAIGNIAVIGKSGSMQETFDEFELNGYPNRHQPLVQTVATSESSWMQLTMGPLLYDNYPVTPEVTITRRNTDVLGIVPLKAVRLTNFQNSYSLSDNDISSGISLERAGRIKLMYYLSFIGFSDFSELRDKAARIAINSSQTMPPGVQKLLSVQGYTDLTAGDYPIEVKYVLPGVNQVTSTKRAIIHF
jgi:hypothetical protein